MRWRPTRVLAAVAAVVFSAILASLATSQFGAASLSRFRSRMLYHPEPATKVRPTFSSLADVKDAPVVLVDAAADEATGQGIVDRRTMAKLVRRLTQLEAWVIGLDVQYETPKKDPGLDSELEAAIRESGRTVLVSWYEERLDRKKGTVEELLFDPCCGFARAARGLGHAQLKLDTDDYLRSLVHVKGTGRDRRGSLALEMFRLAINDDPVKDPPASIEVVDGRIVVTSSTPAASPCRFEIPVDGEGRSWILYQGPAWTVPTLDYRELLGEKGATAARAEPPEPRPLPRERRFDLSVSSPEGAKRAPTLAGKMVVVGNTGLQITDSFRSPFHEGWLSRISGAEIHAQNLLGLLRASARHGSEGKIERAADTSSQVLFALALACAGILALVVPWWAMLIVGFLALWNTWIRAEIHFLATGVFLDPLGPSVAFVSSIVAVISLTAVWERWQRRQIERLMETYFQPDLATAETGPAPEGADALVTTLLKSKEVLAPVGFAIDGPLGTGGMSVVFAARELKTGREIALKFLSPALLPDPESRARFDREARLSAALVHPNVVGVVSSGHRYGIPYIAYERIHGASLRAILQKQKALPYGRAVAMVRDVLAGLATAHEAGVVHRDIKPENVVLTTDGVVKVLDFGIARAQKSDDVFRTRTNVILGTPAYIAPEVVKGGVATPLADIYATGIMLYELIVGGPPFGSDSVSAMLLAHVQKRAPAPREFGIELPKALETVLMSMLQKDPAARPSSALKASEQLAPFATVTVGGDDDAIPVALEQASTQRTQAVRASSAVVKGTIQVTGADVKASRPMYATPPRNVTSKDTPSPVSRPAPELSVTQSDTPRSNVQDEPSAATRPDLPLPDAKASTPAKPLGPSVTRREDREG